MPTQSADEKRAAHAAYERERRKKIRAKKKLEREAARSELNNAKDDATRAAIVNESLRCSTIVGHYAKYSDTQPVRVVIIEKMKPDGFYPFPDGHFRLKDVQYRFFETKAEALSWAKNNGAARIQEFTEQIGK